MTGKRKLLFLVLTAISVAATVEPFSLYTMSTIHVLRVERLFAGVVCLSVAGFTVLIWLRKRWVLSLAVASDLVFGLWYLHRLNGTIRSHNYLSWDCLIIPFAWALSAFIAAGVLMLWGDKYCKGKSPNTASQHISPRGGVKC